MEVQSPLTRAPKRKRVQVRVRVQDADGKLGNFVPLLHSECEGEDYLPRPVHFVPHSPTSPKRRGKTGEGKMQAGSPPALVESPKQGA